MNDELLKLRESLISEAKSSPMLLSDLAGLEAYVSESYNSRSFIELLQNADDAKATKFYVKRSGCYLFVANNGRPFSIKDLESLCRSASSNKVRGTTIGYRGIGFKSVVSFAKDVHLVSGDFEITFSKELSKQIVPQAPKVPLIRIPHELDKSVKNELVDEIKEIQEEGFNTIFIFSGVLAEQIDEEYTSFANTTLLFLKSIQVIKIRLSKKVTANIAVIEENERGRLLRVSTTEAISNWLVCSNSNCCIAFSMNNGKVVRLPKSEAIIHAFLPTEDSCGLGVVVNGDFSTDPSRRHLIMDDTTIEVVNNLTQLYASLLKYALANKDRNMVDALMPYFDWKLIQLMKQSFEREFAKKIKDAFGKYLSNVRLAPSWLNAEDFAKIMSVSNLPYIAPECCDIPGLSDLLKYLGNKPEDVGSLIVKVNNAQISVLGYAQLLTAGIKEALMNHRLPSLTTTALVMSDGGLCSLKEINDEEGEIDESFIKLLEDNGISKNDISQFLKKSGLSNINDLFYDKEDDILNDDDDDDNSYGDESDNPTSVSQWFNNVYAKHLERFGEVEIPSPAMYTFIDLVTERGKLCIPLDMNDSDFTELYCDNVGAMEFIKEHNVAKKGMKRIFDGSTPEKMAKQWDDFVNSNLKSYGKLSKLREEHIANEIKDIAKYKRELLAIIEVERVDGVVSLLGGV